MFFIKLFKFNQNKALHLQGVSKMKEKMNYVTYYRVSTKEQGFSGLGLEDQRKQVKSYIGDNKVIAEFTEVESGKKNSRIELQKAIQFCQSNPGAILIVSKLDRLGRKAALLFEIRDTIPLVVVDKPNMSTLEFAIWAGYAQEEGEKISQRTKAALAIKKDQGFKLGSPEHLTDISRAKSIESRRNKAKVNQKQAYDIAIDLRKSGMSYGKIAEKLNAYKIQSSQGKKYYAASVQHLIKLYESTEEK